MTQSARERHRWMTVTIFAIAMAWFEAACVYYLRVLVDRVEPYQANPLPIRGVLGEVELVREAATLVMLLTVGMLAARTWHKRLAYSAIAFGVWDIQYYVFLRLMCGWPGSPFDWDVLFLLPLPWWGPVAAPISIALLMVVWGTMATQLSEQAATVRISRTAWILNWIGIALALYVFMSDSLRTVYRGEDLKEMLPVSFNWPMFCVALALMAAPVAQSCWRIRSVELARRFISAGDAPL